MNKDNKHSPNPDAFFKLLDHDPPDTEHLDDFEKEALEGFALLDNKQQALDSYQAVLRELSKKNSGQEERRKRPVLWFSAAAGLIAVAGLAVIWLMNNKEIGSGSIAMNDQQVQKQMEVPAEEKAPATGSTAQTTKAQHGPEKEAMQLQQTINTLTPASPVYRAIAETPDKEPAKGIAANTKSNKQETASGETTLTTEAMDKLAADYKKEKEANTFDQDESKLLEKSKDKADKNGEEDAKPVAAADNAGFEWSTSQASTEGKEKPVEAKKTGKLREEKEMSNMPATVSSANTANTTSTPEVSTKTAISSPGSTASLYTGGEKALRDYILKKAKERSPSTQLNGAYTIKAQIEAGGTLKVSSVKAGTGACKGCATLIKDITDKMPGWSPRPNSLENEAILIDLTF